MKKTLALIALMFIVSQILFAGSISGTVNGNPVDDLTVVAFEPSNPQLHFTAPVENGAYTITEVDFGTYIVKLSGFGFHIFYDGVSTMQEATPIEVTDVNPDITGINFNLNAFPQGIIMGSVMNNNGGPGGPGGPGMLDAVLKLYDQLPVDPTILPIQEKNMMGMMYVFDGLEFGTYYISLEIPDEPTLYYDMVEDPALATAIVLDENNPVAVDIDFQIQGTGPGTAEISGVVADDTGSAVENAIVELIAQNGGMPWFQYVSETDENGNYLISEIPAGEYYLSVMADGFLPYYYDGVTNWQDAILIEIEDDDVINIDPVLQTLVLHQITGTVLDDEGNPIEDCLVSAIEDGNGPGGNGGMLGEWSVSTLVDGTFELNIPEGDYYFAAHLMDWMNMQVQYYDHQACMQDADLVTVNAPVSGIDFDFTVVSYNSVVSGTITDFDTLPVEGANAFLYPVDSAQWFFAHSVSDVDGFYEIDNIPPGDYYFSVNAQGYLSYFYDGVSNWEDATIITIVEDDVITIDPVLQSPILYTVSGFVMDDSSNPVSDAIVFAHSNNWNPGNPGGSGNPGNPGGNGCNGGIGNLNTSPDATGYFELEVPGGEYIFGAQTLDLINTQIQFYDHKPSPDVADVVLVEADVIGIDFDFTAPATYDNSISGIVTLATLPVENAMVTCASVDQNFSTATFTNELGQYELANLPENDYYIYAISDGGAPTYYPGVTDFEDAVAVTALGIVNGVDFEIVPINGSGYLGLNGYVTNSQNEPLTNSTITINDDEGNIIAVAQTNGDGFYEVNTVSSGAVTIAATKLFYSTSSTSTTMNGNTSIDFTLEPTGPTGTDDTPEIGDALRISNYPNPFNPTTTISFNLPVSAKVNLEVYNVRGQMVTKLIDDQMEAGVHSIVWNGVDSNQKSVASGIYFYKIKTANQSRTHKMILMK